MKRKYRFYSDAGHGWLAVDKLTLRAFGVEDKISAYSYMRGATAYLEEDCDASLFLKALDDAGIQFEIIEKVCNRSPIRSYDRYQLIG